MKRTAVIGAGMAGLIVALRLLQQRHSVTVYERDTVPGGLASTFDRRGLGFPLERFYHHVFASDTRFVALCDELGVSERLVWTTPRTACLLDGALHELGSASSLLRFAPLAPVERVRLGVALAILKATPAGLAFERIRAAEWLRRVAGTAAYENVFEQLFVGKFGAAAEDVSLAWFWARIHDRTPRLGYVRGGFGAFYDALAQRVREYGGTIAFGADVRAIEPDGSGLAIRCGDVASVAYDRVVATCALAQTARLTPALPASFVEAHSGAPLLAARCAILELSRPLTGTYWINVCEPGWPFSVVVEHTAMMPAVDYGGRHIVYLGRYAAAFPAASADELADEAEPYLRRLNPAFERSWIRDARRFVAGDAQPIVTPGYAAHIAPHATPVAGLYLANLAQVYPHDRGQNYAIELGERVAAAVAAC